MILGRSQPLKLSWSDGSDLFRTLLLDWTANRRKNQPDPRVQKKAWPLVGSRLGFVNFRAWLGLKTMSFHQVVAMVCTHSNSPTEVVLILLVFFLKKNYLMTWVQVQLTCMNLGHVLPLLLSRSYQRWGLSQGRWVTRCGGNCCQG